jgi:hypothetical protein
MAPTEIRSYADLVAALRRRKEALDISYSTAEDIGGLQSGYLSKLMSPTTPSRIFGPISLELTLAALGVRLVLEEDPAAMARIRPRLVPRYSAGKERHAVRHARRPAAVSPQSPDESLCA